MPDSLHQEHVKDVESKDVKCIRLTMFCFVYNDGDDSCDGTVRFVKD